MLSGSPVANSPRNAWAEAYDPRSGSFSDIGTVTEATIGFTTNVLRDGTVLVAGGWGGGPERLRRVPSADSSVRWDPQSETVRPAPLLAPRADHAAVLLSDGRVLLAGGYGTRDDGSMGSLATAELFDPTPGRPSKPV